MTEAPAFATLAQLSDDERITYARLRNQLAAFCKINELQRTYYEGSQKVRQLDIAVPPNLADLAVVAGWPGTAVDVLNERLVWDNWTSTGDLMGLDDMYRENELDLESDLGHADSLMSGIAFTRVGKGDPSFGEPDILITAESPFDCTVLWDYRARRSTASLSRTLNARGMVTMETLDLLDQTITLERKDGKMVVTERDEHNLNRVPVARLVNRARASRHGGRSELTRAVRYYTDAAIRTLLGMEINREFYTTPQRWMMGAEMDQFTKKDGSKATDWDAVMGHMLALPRPFDEESEEYGDLPKVGQFTPASPAPYLEQIRGYSMLFAAEVGFPASYLGYATDNPASADAIRAGETRLIMRSLKRQGGFTPGWRETGYNALLWRDRKVDRAEFAKVSVKWRNPATPTPQAQADEATKLVASQILPPDSSVTYDRIGLTSQEQTQLTADKRRARAQGTISALAAAAEAARQDPKVVDLNSRRGNTG